MRDKNQSLRWVSCLSQSKLAKYTGLEEPDGSLTAKHGECTMRVHQQSLAKVTDLNVEKGSHHASLDVPQCPAL
eukprot:scaffold243154_cov55-Prasinocladus_malaysianus.AAC.1